MLSLILQNGNVFLWNAEDWKKLRQEHRIVGNLFGGLPRAPFQNGFNGLPCILLDEEVTLMLEKGLAKLVTYNSLTFPSEIQAKWEKYKATSKEEQANFILAEKKRSITSMIDRIVEGKRKKLNLMKSSDSDSKTDVELDKENVLRAELERVENTPLSHSLVHTFCEDPWLQNDNFKEVTDWNFPRTEKDSLRYNVYKDLWSRGYYVTCGQKFGGDFLVYPGDPVLYHAHYIILCKDINEPLPWLDISAHCRVGSGTRKTFVIASVRDDNSLYYNSFQFESMSRCFS